ncbi:MAG: DEAD/DEAH box helicase [bacterium]
MSIPKAKRLSRTRKPDDMTLEQWQVELRRQFGRDQQFAMKNIGDHPIFSEFSITNTGSGKTYRVAIRGDRPGINYCSCPDFAVNTIGTCKHIEFALSRLGNSKRARKLLRAGGYTPPFSEVYLRYGAQRHAVFSPGTEAPEGLRQTALQYFTDEGLLRQEAFSRFERFLEEAGRFGHELRCYDDALGFIAEQRDVERRRALIEQGYRNGAGTEKINGLLKVTLYPYQVEGALFAAQAGRCLIADDMGLGKTVQAVAAAEIMAREFGVENALIVCPTSLKYQWKHEIEKFCGRSVMVIEGPSHIRRRLYASDAFFKVVNYELVIRDLDSINAICPDLVILDEAQRIKNWKTRAAQGTKSIASGYAIVLTGTPLENRLEELHSIVQFVDRHRLGPLFRFLADHQISEPETGRAIGYKNLHAIGETLAPILIRRKKKEVLEQLPERMDKNFFVPMTKEQRLIHEENRETVARMVAKWKRYTFLSEADQRRLTCALQNMRMACDNTFLVDQNTCFGPKLDELIMLLKEILEQPDAKVVIFSQWQRMNSLVSRSLEREGIPFVYLHGGVPGKGRKDLTTAFREDPAIRIFLSTDAGGTGLNLQSASTVINLDLPWNPAVIEQRIGRVHRIGQHQPVRVINLISEGTIEHGMLDILSFKRSIFAGVLDGGEDAVFMGKTRLNRFMESVDAVTGHIPETAQEPPPIQVQEEADEEEKPCVAPAPAMPLQPLLEAGAAFLKQLGTFVAEGRKQGHPPLASLIDTDKESGRSYLRIPVPEPKVMEGLVSAIGPLLDMFKQGMQDAPKEGHPDH